MICGPGEWSAPVAPVTYSEAEIWRSDQWESADLRSGPLGLEFGSGTFRITGAAGDNQAPGPDAMKAYHHYAEFLAETGKRPGYDSWAFRIDGGVSINWKREQNALAKGIYGSGAADMLRKYRRVR